MSLEFFVPGSPISKGSMRAFIPKGWVRPVLTSTGGKPLKDWEKAIKAKACVAKAEYESRYGPWQLDGACSVMIAFYLPRPKSLPKKVLWPVKKPDCDKLVRAACDPLTGVLYHDDSQIITLQALKFYADDNDELPAGMRLTIMQREGKGLS